MLQLTAIISCDEYIDSSFIHLSLTTANGECSVSLKSAIGLLIMMLVCPASNGEQAITRVGIHEEPGRLILLKHCQNAAI